MVAYVIFDRNSLTASPGDVNCKLFKARISLWVFGIIREAVTYDSPDKTFVISSKGLKIASS